MAVSHSEQVEAICPYCETPFSTEAWTIVDVWERPDLAVRLQQGLLHITFCPHCQKRVAVDTPLLVYRLYKDPPFLLSMPDDTSEEDARAHAAVLLGRLREALGKDWKPSWLDHQYETIDRVEVRVLLNLDLILLIRQKMMLDEAEQTLDAGQAPPLLQALWAVLSAETWEDAGQALKAHPELLTDEALAALDEFIRAAEVERDRELIAVFGEHRALLSRCREIGIDAALEEVKKE